MLSLVSITVLLGKILSRQCYHMSKLIHICTITYKTKCENFAAEKAL